MSKVSAVPQISIPPLDNIPLLSNHLIISSPIFPPHPGLMPSKFRAGLKTASLCSDFGNLSKIFRILCSQHSCSLVCRHTFGSAAQKPDPPSAIANDGSFIPRFFNPINTLYQLSADSRKPSSSANRCFLPEMSTPIITSKHRFSS